MTDDKVSYVSLIKQSQYSMSINLPKEFIRAEDLKPRDIMRIYYNTVEHKLEISKAP